jgi:hypothetical protein
MKNLDNILKLKNVLNHKFGDMPEPADDEMDGGCPEGYVQDGTKMVDGKEVPNCVLKKEQEIEDEVEEDMMYDFKNYPWDQCIMDNEAKYGKKGAEAVCGAIKEKYGDK